MDKRICRVKTFDDVKISALVGYRNTPIQIDFPDGRVFLLTEQMIEELGLNIGVNHAHR